MVSADRRPLRVAIVSTPRSGNTWLRLLLSRACAARELAAHVPGEIDWSAPEPCVVQLHWHPSERLLAELARHGWRVVTLARHPLDVLVSILHFAPGEPTTARWLQGEGGDERSIIGAMPRSAAFLGYATGPRAAALLAVSTEWWARGDTLRVRYEELVADPAGEVGRLLADLGVEPRQPLAEVAEALTIAKLRAIAQDHHHWKGQPGLWRRLLPAAEVETIARRHAEVFDLLQYPHDPDPGLTAARADANWVDLVREERLADLQKLGALRRELQQAHDALVAARREPGRASPDPLERLRPRQDDPPPPAPPAALLRRVTSKEDPDHFHLSGKLTVVELDGALRATLGVGLETFGRILDWGCGCGRLLRWLRRGWPAASLSGSDIDGEAVAWVAEHVPEVDARAQEGLPPLPFADAAFDLVVGFSVLTHLPEDYQDAWLAELRRVARPGAALLLTVAGERAWRRNVQGFGPLRADPAFGQLEAQLVSRGFAYWDKEGWEGVGFPPYYHTAFHRPHYVREHWRRWFEVVAVVEGGALDKQDIVVLRRPAAPA